MKAIKELEHHELHLLANEIRFPTWVWLEEDVVKLIDEFDFCNGCMFEKKIKKKLKSKIQGK